MRTPTAIEFVGPINQKCYGALRDGKHPDIEATLIGFAPVPPGATSETLITKGHPPLSVNTVDALVVLNTFSRGAIFQVPLSRVKVVSTYYDDEE